jgi:hypothetical protein
MNRRARSVSSCLRLLATLVVVMLGVGVTACGSTDRSTGSRYHIPTKAAESIPPATVASSAASILPYLNDGDHDRIGDADGDNSHDDDNDAYLDHQRDDNGLYHDSDDSLILAYGHAASATEERVIAGIVKRYYAAAAARNGEAACAQFPPIFVKAVPVDYGKFGSSYLHAGKGCAGVLDLLFRHYRKQLIGGVRITGVRVEGDHATALLGSKTMPASYISLVREAGVWKIVNVLGSPLP